ncbi:MAG: PaxA [Myxococcaceae bacterium]
MSIALHVGFIAVVGYLTASGHAGSVMAKDPSVTFFAAPPPPPPPPAARRSADVTPRRSKPVQRETLIQPKEIPIQKPPEAEPQPDEPEPDEGTAGGVEGGVVGGVVGGTVGGVVGGTVGGSLSGAKTIPGFIFEKQLLSSPAPQLPDEFTARHPGQTLRTVYRICVNTDGSVAEVSVVSGIPEVDQMLINQIRGAWKYRPQPVPVCSQRAFVFKVI